MSEQSTANARVCRANEEKVRRELEALWIHIRNLEQRLLNPSEVTVEKNDPCDFERYPYREHI